MLMCNTVVVDFFIVVVVVVTTVVCVSIICLDLEIKLCHI